MYKVHMSTKELLTRFSYNPFFAFGNGYLSSSWYFCSRSILPLLLEMGIQAHHGTFVVDQSKCPCNKRKTSLTLVHLPTMKRDNWGIKPCTHSTNYCSCYDNICEEALKWQGERQKTMKHHAYYSYPTLLCHNSNLHSSQYHCS